MITSTECYTVVEVLMTLIELERWNWSLFLRASFCLIYFQLCVWMLHTNNQSCANGKRIKILVINDFLVKIDIDLIWCRHTHKKKTKHLCACPVVRSRLCSLLTEQHLGSETQNWLWVTEVMSSNWSAERSSHSWQLLKSSHLILMIWWHILKPAFWWFQWSQMTTDC